MTKLEKYILIFAIILLIVTSLIFSIHFYSFPISDSTTDWGAVGDFFGGVLSPILSFLIIILIIREAVENRKIVSDNKKAQLISQSQINKQIELLSPKPDLVYYLSAVNSMVFATIENIGNAVAYDIIIDFSFAKEFDSFGKDWIVRLSTLSYIPPKYKNGIFISHINIKREVIGVPEHKVVIKFKVNREDENEIKKEFIVDKNMLGTIFNRSELSTGLKHIEQAIKGIK